VFVIGGFMSVLRTDGLGSPNITPDQLQNHISLRGWLR
jgi:hypothetical protein